MCEKMIRKLLRRVSAGLLSGVMIASAAVSPVSAAVVDKENPNNYDNFAEALQLALCFYDATFTRRAATRFWRYGAGAARLRTC